MTVSQKFHDTLTLISQYYSKRCDVAFSQGQHSNRLLSLKIGRSVVTGDSERVARLAHPRAVHLEPGAVEVCLFELSCLQLSLLAVVYYTQLVIYINHGKPDIIGQRAYSFGLERSPFGMICSKTVELANFQISEAKKQTLYLVK